MYINLPSPSSVYTAPLPHTFYPQSVASVPTE